MGQGLATASAPVVCATPAEIKTEVDKLTLTNADAGVTAGDMFDSIVVVPINNGQYLVFKIEYAAS
jgi:hypothetical protein